MRIISFRARSETIVFAGCFVMCVCIYSTPYIVTGFHVRDIPVGYPHTRTYQNGNAGVRRPLGQPDFPLSLACCSSYVAATDAAAAAAHYTD
jgi:hypothetical protein